MKIHLDWRKSAQENAARYYALSKELAAKWAGAEHAIRDTKKEIEQASNAAKRAAEEGKAPPRMKRRKEWFEKYRWFFTSGNRLVIAGRDAKQNDLLVARLMEDDDLFFHADIQGAPATILKGGMGASGQEKKEAAQFAASHSSAWKVGAASVDVYAVKKSQLSKHAQGGFVGAGGFAISGEREWFRSTPLCLAVLGKEGAALCIPACHPLAKKAQALLEIGSEEKGAAAKKISNLAGVDADEALLALPSGRFAVKRQVA